MKRKPSVKAHKLLAKPERLTKHVFARDVDGNPVASHSKSAVAWSVDGAIRKCYPNATRRTAATGRLLAVIWTANVPMWNDADYREHSTVVATLKEAEV